MAVTVTPMDEHDLFVRAMNTYIPVAKVWVEVRGWEDPRPTYTVTFKNGAVFEGQTKHVVINDAKVYADGLYRLTGEFP